MFMHPELLSKSFAFWGNSCKGYVLPLFSAADDKCQLSEQSILKRENLRTSTVINTFYSYHMFACDKFMGTYCKYKTEIDKAIKNEAQYCRYLAIFVITAAKAKKRGTRCKTRHTTSCSAMSTLRHLKIPQIKKPNVKWLLWLLASISNAALDKKKETNKREGRGALLVFERKRLSVSPALQSVSHGMAIKRARPAITEAAQGWKSQLLQLMLLHCLMMSDSRRREDRGGKR